MDLELNSPLGPYFWDYKTYTSDVSLSVNLSFLLNEYKGSYTHCCLKSCH